MNGKEKILVVEDEKLIRMTLRERLRAEGYVVEEAECGNDALTLAEQDPPDLILVDYRLPDVDGIEVLRNLRRRDSNATVIMMTAYSTVDTAVEALKLGAYDYVKKPVNHDDLLVSIAKALECTRLRREVRHIRDEQKKLFRVANIIGRSDAMKEVFVMIHKVAHSAATTVLIQGDSGTGKDLVAKAIHYTSDRADKPFMNITCSALPETLLESELFGHERGAFTDAKQQKKGLLELASGGTVFLDEIGDMGLALQSKLLRFLEEKAFKRVGGTRDIRVDVRVIAATNRPLGQAVREGAFREDLYYRLKVIPIHLPALRDRKEDIPDLVHYFIDHFNRDFHKNARSVTDEAMACLERYDWPGNVRELRNVIERAMILESKEELDVTDLPEELVQTAEAVPAYALAAVAVGGDPAIPMTGAGAAHLFSIPEGGVALVEVERELVRQALGRAAGNQSRAARLLRISRDALRYKMKKFDLL